MFNIEVSIITLNADNIIIVIYCDIIDGINIHTNQIIYQQLTTMNTFNSKQNIETNISTQSKKR